MMKKMARLHIRSKIGVWIFAIAVVCLTVFISNRLVFVLFPLEDYAFTAPRAAFITLAITLPVCLFIGEKIRENTGLADELVRLVNRDRLTDASTRDFFFERMRQDPEAYGVSLMVDIDHFKLVNDTHGHFAGDEVIKHVSDVLRTQTRERDILCRFGGEEFVVFLHEANGELGMKIAERMRQSVQSKPALSEGIEVSVTISIGGSLKERMEDINISIQQADEALYKVKHGGRNQIVVDWTDPESKPA
jgi:diguanylate cyclase (GGDEF)-like protein